MFDDITWSTTSYSLKGYIDYFSLPQLVKVEHGLYSEEEANTLSAEQILTLHYTKRTDKVFTKAADRKPFYIPINFPGKVEILPTFCQDMYYSVQDIVDEPSIKFIKAVHDSPPSFGLKAGDILKLVKTVEEYREKYVLCEFSNKTRDLVKLPLSFKAAFVPLAKAETFHLQEVLNSQSAFKLPVRVKFSCCETLIQDVNKDIDLLSFGSVLLKEKLEESTIIATSRWDNTVTVVMIPTDLDVTVHPAEGAINGDSTYARFCREIHDGADLEKVELSLSNYLRVEEKPNVDVLYDYVEVRPQLPPRGSTSSLLEVNDDSSDDDYLDIPPPRPPKPEYLHSLPLSPTHAPSQLQQHGDRESFENMPSDGHDECPPPPVRTASLQPSNDNHLQGYKHDDNQPDSAEEDYLYPEEFDMERETPQTLPKTPPPTLPKPPGHRMRQVHHHFPSPGDGDDNDDDDYDEEDYLNTEDSDFDDSSEEHDYLYPEYPVYENSEVTSTAMKPQPGHGQSKGTWLSKFFRKTTSKSSKMTCSSSSSATYSTKQDYSSSDFPDDLSSVSVAELGECLRKLNLEKHVDTFSSNQIDGKLFLTFDKELLSSLGVDNVFEQTKLMNFINGWRPRT